VFLRLQVKHERLLCVENPGVGQTLKYRNSEDK